MKLTREWLEGQNACSEGVGWWVAYGNPNPIKTLEKLREIVQ